MGSRVLVTVAAGLARIPQGKGPKTSTCVLALGWGASPRAELRDGKAFPREEAARAGCVLKSVPRTPGTSRRETPREPRRQDAGSVSWGGTEVKRLFSGSLVSLFSGFPAGPVPTAAG